jgi:hypothetical protein
VVRAKDKKVVPFVMNRAQHYIHSKLEEQKKKLGFVRAIILKGRQQGASTYVAGRFYSKASLFKNTSVFILAHEQAASDALFDIVSRYHTNNPIAPTTGKANVKELEFKYLGSRYIVATAGAKATGRSRTIDFLHGSECAFWTNASEHFASSVQAVPELPGTEVILESTANGPSGEFYERVMNAVAGIGDYILIFIPWFWSHEYSREVPAGFELEVEVPDGGIMSEQEYQELYAVPMGHMVWRRAKIAELRSQKLFMQEYPATVHEAFQTTNDESYIESMPVLRARKRDREALGPLVIGADPAGPGGDRFSVAWRRGLCVEKVEFRNKLETLEAVEWLHSIIQDDDPAVVNIDAGGIGAAVISVLRTKDPRYRRLVKAINFGGTSQHKLAKPKMPGPKNRRAEMWTRLKDWLSLEEGVSLPDRDDIQADIVAPRLKKNLTNDILLESKEEMRSRGVRSPDLGDSICLTFADLRHIKNWSSKKKKRAEFGTPDVPTADAPTRRSVRSVSSSRNGWMM